MKDIRALDLNLLRTLDALLDERSVTRTAERLGFTQPAVSGMLTRLRESFDDPLFVRTQRGIVPTLRATELAGPIKQILSDVETLLQPSAFDPLTAEFTLNIAATDYTLQAVVVPFLAKLRRQAPGIRIAIRTVEDDRVQMQFERGELDLALMTPEAAPPDLHARRLFDETYVCALRTTHPDAAAGSISLDRFCALDHALVSYAGERFWGVTDDALTRSGRKRRVVLTVTSFLVLGEVLRATDLIAVAPRRLVSCVDGLTTLEPPVEIPGFTKLAVWHERTHRDPGHRWVRMLLFETCGCLQTGQEFGGMAAKALPEPETCA
ncbi:LysR family transcriptional regulator [Ancylobacter defluvii]|uniref:Transcriptional regulator n=1 Tax=Ancylobacter defluvii TaxID=1282440 RepID=A0A9W6JY77_9HYPH|nr:LysR family transcriptional regulator [Ancylobacter defluvii]MBS7586780.1 LysR family transcriptional regulator [Ancylobacter defluvii]GLK86085.1 transcriptional regulator [Ancylobacter defluvii]